MSSPNSNLFSPRADLDNSVYVVPALTLMSCIPCYQYANFCLRPSSERSRKSLCLATVGMALHLAQIILDLWYMGNSFHSYFSGGDDQIFFYTALEVWLAVGVASTIQYHYFRLTQVMPSLSRGWTYAIGFFAIANCIGGLGAGAQFQKISQRARGAPPTLSGIDFLAFYNMWLIANVLTDGTISITMVKALSGNQSQIRKQSLATTLRRILFLTYVRVNIHRGDVILVSVPHIIPDMPLLQQKSCRLASYIFGGMLPRIYLTSFSFSVPEAQGQEQERPWRIQQFSPNNSESLENNRCRLSDVRHPLSRHIANRSLAALIMIVHDGDSSAICMVLVLQNLKIKGLTRSS
ncbi:hypothetical protein MJO29_012587 [Puccinia striiformis f. sp. tritici]|uniref:Uncharacterized protein n=1 Tax=Puccinia striiformis TaxID=27350 RepID=A0A2S4UZJ3_9BASI|nr:hypothetical protein MJO29_012587 [Puccinia striiformis f. sp. tritici]POW02671.1 hypothetical protein PSTT_11589 [Puccinia striiformis]